jgi:two-component system heavy metal sensor histidine kinase CusS
MKPPSLSRHLGLSVSLMGAVLVALLACLNYWTLTLELDARARINLNGKMETLQRHLTDNLKASDIANSPHSITDLVISHDNLSLTIYSLGEDSSPLLSLGEKSFEPQLNDFSANETLRYQHWKDRQGEQILTAFKRVQLANGEQILTLLSINRSADAALLSAYLKSTLIAVPALMLLIGFVSWWIVRRGLAPLRQFRTIAAQICAKDISHRLSQEKLPKELSGLASSINLMLDRLDNGVQLLSEFSDDLAHELRAPITNLLCKAQVTLSRERPREDYRSALESCVEELERLSRIVSDMLFLAHASHPTAAVSFQPVALHEEVWRVTELFSASAEEKQISLSISGSGSTLGDRLMIQRAISNLLSNAIRHSPEGREISILIEPQADMTSLVMGNSGSSIPAQHLTHLFERFYRVDKSRSRSAGGTGLGLAIVNSIMSLHQGNVAVSSLEGFTRFSLSFPTIDAATNQSTYSKLDGEM